MTTPAPHVAAGIGAAGAVAAARTGGSGGLGGVGGGEARGSSFAELLGGDLSGARRLAIDAADEPVTVRGPEPASDGSGITAIEPGGGASVRAMDVPSAALVDVPFDGPDTAPLGDVEGRFAMSGPRAVPVASVGVDTAVASAVDVAVDVDARAAPAAGLASMRPGVGKPDVQAPVAVAGTPSSGDALAGPDRATPSATDGATSEVRVAESGSGSAAGKGGDAPTLASTLVRGVRAHFASGTPSRGAVGAAPAVPVARHAAGPAPDPGSDAAAGTSVPAVAQAAPERVAAGTFAVRLAVAAKGQDDGYAREGDAAVSEADRSANAVMAQASATGAPAAAARATALPPTIATSDAPPLVMDAPEAADDLAATVRTLAAGGRSAARIELTPVELGSLTIDLERSGDRLAVGVYAATAATRDLVEALLPRLRELLAGDGVADVRVGAGDDGTKQESARQNAGQTAGQNAGQTAGQAAGQDGSQSERHGARQATVPTNVSLDAPSDAHDGGRDDRFGPQGAHGTDLEHRPNGARVAPGSAHVRLDRWA